jgi:DNA-binding response OmpR family regulator
VRETTSPVLVVEDDGDSRAAICSMLSLEGYSVVQVADGKQALDLLVSEGQERPCLIVLDLGMPVMSGWEFLAIARNYARLASIPVLVTSGRQDHPEALKHGAIIGRLHKPLNFQTLLATVRRVVQEHSQIAGES